MLQDGTLIDLCGATLLWRSADGLAKSPVSKTSRYHFRLKITWFVYLFTGPRIPIISDYNRRKLLTYFITEQKRLGA